MASGNNMKSAETTYSGFISLLKYGSIAVAIITAFVIILIA